MTDQTPTTPSAAVRLLGYDLLRIWSILAVVAIHTFGQFAVDDSARGNVSWWAGLALQTGSIWCVPVFVMLAGALSLRPEAHRMGARAFLVKRGRRIIPAILVWTVVYLVGVRILLLHEHLSGAQVLQTLVDASVYPQLYFLWLIAGLYLVAPVIAAFLKDGGEHRALIFAVVAMTGTVVIFTTPYVYKHYGIDVPLYLQALTMWLPYVGYFVMGYALSRLTLPRWLIGTCGVLAIALATLTIFEVADPIRFRVLQIISPPSYLGAIVGLLAVCVFVAGVSLLGRIPLGPRASRFVVMMSEATFGVFLIHLLVLLLPYQLLAGFRQHTSFVEAVVAYVSIVTLSFAMTVGARKIPVLRAVF
ncbi:acyltransferase [soil metagenome]